MCCVDGLPELTIYLVCVCVCVSVCVLCVCVYKRTLALVAKLLLRKDGCLSGSRNTQSFSQLN